MVLSYEEAIAAVTAPGQRFELGTATVRGVETPLFVNAPPSLRDALAMAHLRGEAEFLVYEDEHWSFGDVGRHVGALGALLVDHYGVRKGDRVAIAMRNYPEWIVSFAAILSIGAISVSMNAWWTEEEIDFALEDSGAKVVIADADRARRSAGPAERLGARHPHCPGAGGHGAAGGCRTRRGPARSRCRAPRSRHRPGRRRHDPLHLRHDRAPEGSGLDSSGDSSVANGFRVPCDGGSAAPPARRRARHRHRHGRP